MTEVFVEQPLALPGSANYLETKKERQYFIGKMSTSFCPVLFYVKFVILFFVFLTFQASSVVEKSAVGLLGSIRMHNCSKKSSGPGPLFTWFI